MARIMPGGERELRVKTERMAEDAELRVSNTETRREQQFMREAHGLEQQGREILKKAQHFQMDSGEGKKWGDFVNKLERAYHNVSVAMHHGGAEKTKEPFGKLVKVVNDMRYALEALQSTLKSPETTPTTVKPERAQTVEPTMITKEKITPLQEQIRIAQHSYEMGKAVLKQAHIQDMDDPHDIKKWRGYMDTLDHAYGDVVAAGTNDGVEAAKQKINALGNIVADLMRALERQQIKIRENIAQTTPSVVEQAQPISPPTTPSSVFGKVRGFFRRLFQEPQRTQTERPSAQQIQRDILAQCDRIARMPYRGPISRLDHEANIQTGNTIQQLLKTKDIVIPRERWIKTIGNATACGAQKELEELRALVEMLPNKPI